MKKLKEKLDNFWGISKLGSSFKVEIIAGIATFLAMSYILIVNPNQILYAGSADPRWSSIFIATAFGAVIGTLLMSVYAKMPLAQASGMGLNSALGSVIGGGVGAFAYGFTYSLANALFLVFISGIIFLLVSIIPISKNKETGKWITLREKIFDGMPDCIKKSISVGIGLFITFIGLQNAKIINANPYTLVEFVDLTKVFTGSLTDAAGNLYAFTYAIVGLISFISIAILAHYKVKGAVIFGILIATVVAIPLRVTNFDILLGTAEGSGVTWKFWESFGDYFSKDGVFATLFKDGWNMPKGSLFTSIMLVITFAMIDMFDTMGTVVGCCQNAGLVDETGKPLNYNKIMVCDSIATVSGAILGTSTVTTFVESGTGVAAGGKTGFSSLITTLLFFLSIFLLPLFAFIPSAAAAGALMYVGVLMMSGVKNIDFSNIKSAVPSFLTIVTMILAYSITKGIGIGIISYVLIEVVTYIVDLIKYTKNKEGSKPKCNISIVLLVVMALFLVYFFVPTVF